MQLLRITSVPIELKIEIERAHFKRQEAERNARTADADVANVEKQIKSLEKKVETAETQAQANKTDENGKNGAEYAAGKGGDKTAENARDGKISTISVVKNSEQFIDIKQTASSAKSGGNSAAKANDGNVHAPESLSKLSGQEELAEKIKKHYAELNKAIYEYVQGEVNLEVEKNPEVKVEYIGGFVYVPPESNPDYEDE